MPRDGARVGLSGKPSFMEQSDCAAFVRMQHVEYFPRSAWRARIEHAIGPAGDMRGHQHIRQFVEGARGRGCTAWLAGISIPHIKRGTRDRTPRQGLVERILIDDLRPRPLIRKAVDFIKASCRRSIDPIVSAVAGIEIST